MRFASPDRKAGSPCSGLSSLTPTKSKSRDFVRPNFPKFAGISRRCIWLGRRNGKPANPISRLRTSVSSTTQTGIGGSSVFRQLTTARIFSGAQFACLLSGTSLVRWDWQPPYLSGCQAERLHRSLIPARHAGESRAGKQAGCDRRNRAYRRVAGCRKSRNPLRPGY